MFSTNLQSEKQAARGAVMTDKPPHLYVVDDTGTAINE